ncbi:MAG: 3-hydroxyacyl-ACP dehydratase FabZ family protein [Planctomycetaceae bacterium]
MAPQPIYDVNQLDLDFDNPVYDLQEIRRVNPQRHEMEQLSGIVYVDRENHGLIGFKDITDTEFWIAGHMPGFPLMPGVMLCECAAQLAGFYARKFDIMGGDYLGFGGMNNVRFRFPVFPKTRLVLAVRATRVRPKRRAEFDFQGFVDGKLVFNGEMIGVPIMRKTDIR